MLHLYENDLQPNLIEIEAWSEFHNFFAAKYFLVKSNISVSCHVADALFIF